MLFDFRHVLSHNVIYIIKFNKFAFNKMYPLKCMGFDFQENIRVGKWKKKWPLVFMCSFHQGFPGGSEDKVSACNAGDLGSIPGLGRSPGEGNDNPLQYSCLENPMDRGAQWATVHGVAKSQTRLSDFTYSGKELACQRRRHKRLRFDPQVRQIPWRTAWQPTSVLLPGESHGQRSLTGYSSQGRKELDTTEAS